MTRLALSALLAILALFGAAPQAFAHTELVSSDPADGASPPQRPTRLTLTFTQPVPAESATVTVTGPDGVAWPLGEVVADGATLTIPMGESGSPAGRYTVSWMVEALDGDFTDGTFAFTLTSPPQAPAVTPPPTAPAVTPPAVTTPAGTPTSAASTGSAATVTAVATGTTTPAATVADDEGSGPPLWVWIVLVAVLSVVGIAVAVALSRRAGGETEKPAE